MKQRVIVGLTGASGVIYGIRMLEHLARIDDVETHLVVSDGGRITIPIETRYKLQDVFDLADHVHRAENLAASIASGSFRTAGMVVVPCSVKTLSGIVNSYADNLVARAADVCLKEGRKLILVVRETPLHKGHLELMVRAADYGATILPPVPAFYHQPQTIDDLIDHTVGKICDALGLETDLFQRWGEAPRPQP